MKRSAFVVLLSGVLCLSLGAVHKAAAQATVNGRPIKGPANSNLRLQIERAIYGYNGKGNDVTDRVRAQIRNNRIDMQVTNDTMGGDPNKNNKKNLKVLYTYGNKNYTKFVNEKDYLRIP